MGVRRQNWRHPLIHIDYASALRALMPLTSATRIPQNREILPVDKSISFSVDRFNDEPKNEGRFEMSAALSKADDKVSEALERWEGGQISTNQLVNDMRKLLEKYPDLIEAHVTIGSVTLESSPAMALEHYQRAFATGIAAMPAGYSGTLSYYELSNRAFLRAVHGLALTHRALGDHQKAVNILERSLAWNENDNLGCRDLLAEYVGDPSVTVSFDLSIYSQPKF